MAYGRAIICRFDTVSDLRGKNRTYENIKAAVLAAGRFSCFDIETKKDAVMFTELCRDPEIETFDMGYPWTGVRRRTKADGASVCANCGYQNVGQVCTHCGFVNTPRRSRKPLAASWRKYQKEQNECLRFTQARRSERV